MILEVFLIGTKSRSVWGLFPKKGKKKVQFESQTYNHPLVAIEFLLGGLLDPHALRLGLFARHRTLSPGF